MSDEEVLPRLGIATVTGGKSEWTLKLDAAACEDGYPNTMMLISAAGPQTSVNAFGAALSASSSVRATCSLEGGSLRRFVDYEKHQDGYSVYKSKLAYGTWHILAIAKDVTFLPSLSETSVWRLLRSESFTTPVIRPWVPWLMKHLMTVTPDNCNAYPLRRLRCFNCDAAVLRLDTTYLDQCIQYGLRSGAIAIPTNG